MEGVEGTEFGRYRLLDPLGAGAMGEVHRAYDTGTERMVALKVLSKEFAQDSTYRRRFQREAQLVARLHEPHIVPIHDFGEIDGRLFLDMRLVEAPNLATLLSDGGPLDAAAAVAVIAQIAAALDAAHAGGVVHRDVKPSNILVTPDGFAYLIDFGIARSGQDTTLTRAGTMIGTLAYMAPERLTLDRIDARSDVYSLACVLYECLAGTKPYLGDSVERQIAAHLTDRPPLPSAAGVPHAFDTVIAVGMAKDPDDRYGSAGALAAAAQQALLPADPAPPLAPVAEIPADNTAPADSAPAGGPGPDHPRYGRPPVGAPPADIPPIDTPLGGLPSMTTPPRGAFSKVPAAFRGRTAAAAAALVMAVAGVSALVSTRDGSTVVTDAPEPTAPPAVSVTLAPGAPAADTPAAPEPRPPEGQQAPSVTRPLPEVPPAPPIEPGGTIAEPAPSTPAGGPVDQPGPAPSAPPLPTTSVAAPSTGTTTPTTTETSPTPTTDPGTTTPPTTTPSGHTTTTTPPETTGTGEQTGSAAGTTSENVTSRGSAIATSAARVPSSDPIASSATAPTRTPAASPVPAPPGHAPSTSASTPAPADTPAPTPTRAPGDFPVPAPATTAAPPSA